MRLAAVVLAGCWTSPAPAPVSHRTEAVQRPRAPAALLEVKAAALLTEDMVRAVAGYGGPFEVGPMDVVGATYDDVHYKASGKTEEYDVALRVWKLGPAAATRRYDELRASLPGVQDTSDIPDRSLIAHEVRIRGVAFLDRRGLVVLLTCGEQQCATDADSVKLARAVRARIPAR